MNIFSLGKLLPKRALLSFCPFRAIRIAKDAFPLFCSCVCYVMASDGLSKDAVRQRSAALGTESVPDRAARKRVQVGSRIGRMCPGGLAAGGPEAGWAWR